MIFTIENDTTKDVRRYNAAKDFWSRFLNTFKGKFVGKGWTELVISGRKRWKDNRSILRNKKLVANIASNSFYDSDENDCRFVTGGWNRYLLGECMVVETFVKQLSPISIAVPLNYTDCCRPVVSWLHNASQLCIVRISAEQVTAFLLRDREKRAFYGQQNYSPFYQIGLFSLPFLIVTLCAIVITIVRVPLHNRSIVTIKISRWR